MPPLGNWLRTPSGNGRIDYQRLTSSQKAKLKGITIHGLRHTAATLMLLAKVPVHVVAARLGHADTHTTLSVYAHVLRDSHKEAADVLGKVLHG
jgi:integrase